MSNAQQSAATREPQNWEKFVLTVMAVWIIALGSYLVIRNRRFEDPNLVVIFRTMLSLGVAALGATIPGFLNVGFTMRGWTIRAGGALALFLLTFFGSPKVFSSLRISDEMVGPNAFPPESIIESSPGSELARAAAPLAGKEVQFFYRNSTGVDMKLYMYDFWKRERYPNLTRQSFWAAFPFPATDSYLCFSRFGQTNGWIGLAIGWYDESGAIRFQYLATKNLFYSKRPTLTVAAKADPLPHFVPLFSTRDAEDD